MGKADAGDHEVEHGRKGSKDRGKGDDAEIGDPEDPPAAGAQVPMIHKGPFPPGQGRQRHEPVSRIAAHSAFRIPHSPSPAPQTPSLPGKTPWVFHLREMARFIDQDETRTGDALVEPLGQVGGSKGILSAPDNERRDLYVPKAFVKIGPPGLQRQERGLYGRRDIFPVFPLVVDGFVGSKGRPRRARA